jgi:RNA methyltransferase, TrmH family
VEEAPNKEGTQTTGQYLLDGWHLVNEAVKAHVAIKTLLITAKQTGDRTGLDSFSSGH